MKQKDIDKKLIKYVFNPKGIKDKKKVRKDICGSKITKEDNAWKYFNISWKMFYDLKIIVGKKEFELNPKYIEVLDFSTIDKNDFLTILLPVLQQSSVKELQLRKESRKIDNSDDGWGVDEKISPHNFEEIEEYRIYVNRLTISILDLINRFVEESIYNRKLKDETINILDEQNTYVASSNYEVLPNPFLNEHRVTEYAFKDVLHQILHNDLKDIEYKTIVDSVVAMSNMIGVDIHRKTNIDEDNDKYLDPNFIGPSVDEPDYYVVGKSNRKYLPSRIIFSVLKEMGIIVSNEEDKKVYYSPYQITAILDNTYRMDARTKVESIMTILDSGITQKPKITSSNRRAIMKIFNFDYKY